ncbi:ATP-binding protein [Pararhodobacter oceanensis]|uniref:ATP-binding protein n=1 Tax=Pararhodobacter oceanensis TaxID=2172121 RepID=A0A2T8HR84_9RHOB|nr:ATP-binding protein [Pararhodobacter oceanensis]PVH27893.1 ATP-binding protein [Pararhodobacter oceanensis]
MTAPSPPEPAGSGAPDGNTPMDPPSLGKIFAGRFTSGDMATRRVLARVKQGLTKAGLGEEDLATVELILAEALNNVVEHAYADAPGPVELSVALQSYGLSCSIIDSGRPMPSDDAPNPDLPVIDPPIEIPEGGFGWHIIRCLTRDLEYRRDGMQNRLSMTVPLEDLER